MDGALEGKTIAVVPRMPSRAESWRRRRLYGIRGAQRNTRHSAGSRWKGERGLGKRARECCWARGEGWPGEGRLGERMAGRTEEGSGEGNRG